MLVTECAQLALRVLAGAVQLVSSAKVLGARTARNSKQNLFGEPCMHHVAEASS
jgi:hypothetical protein